MAELHIEGLECTAYTLIAYSKALKQKVTHCQARHKNQLDFSYNASFLISSYLAHSGKTIMSAFMARILSIFSCVHLFILYESIFITFYILQNLWLSKYKKHRFVSSTSALESLRLRSSTLILRHSASSISLGHLQPHRPPHAGKRQRFVVVFIVSINIGHSNGYIPAR